MVSDLNGKKIGETHVSRDRQRGHIILAPGKYLLECKRGHGHAGDNFRVSQTFTIDLNRPGMYTLKFLPRLGTAEISGTLRGCYIDPGLISSHRGRQSVYDAFVFDKDGKLWLELNDYLMIPV